MTNQNQKQPKNRQNMQHSKSEITQNRPSHMNQGNETFHPDQQKEQNQGERHETQKNSRTAPSQQQSSRKAS